MISCWIKFVQLYHTLDVLDSPCFVRYKMPLAMLAMSRGESYWGCVSIWLYPILAGVQSVIRFFSIFTLDERHRFVEIGFYRRTVRKG